jgi:hypothetical protein
MASASLHHITAGFPHQHLTPITDVNHTTLTVLQGEINANAISVHSNRGDGQSGHFILTCRPETWVLAQLPGAPAFIVPINPGNLPDTVNMTVAQRTVTLAEHQQNQVEFQTFTFTTNALRQQLIKALPATYIATLKHPEYGYSRVSPLTILSHLWTEYGTISSDELRANNIALNNPTWDPATPIEDLYNRIKSHGDFARAGNTIIEDLLLAEAAYINVEATGLYATYCANWRARPQADKSFTQFRTYFTAAHKDVHRITASSAGYHANAATISDNAKDALILQLQSQVVDAYAHHGALAATKSTVNSDKDKDTLILQLQAQIMTLMNAQKADPTKHYCWLHGRGKHPGSKCDKRTMVGFQEKATWKNKMGGSTDDRTDPAYIPLWKRE